MTIKLKYLKITSYLTLFLVCFSLANLTSQTMNANRENLYPWCIVAYDSVKRSPEKRIALIKELGFSSYAYDWRQHHLGNTYQELQVAEKNEIKVMSVWLWLNAKNDRLNKLSAANEELISIVEKSGIKTTFWLSFNDNFFKGLSQEESLEKAIEYVSFIGQKVQKIGCEMALYNHSGWFGDPYNIISVIKALPALDLSMVFNFHHAFDYLDSFEELAEIMTPYLSAVNLNGMKKDGPKILTIGQGDYEKNMVQQLIINGFNGPWGILGHVENTDVKTILEDNLEGLQKLE